MSQADGEVLTVVIDHSTFLSTVSVQSTSASDTQDAKGAAASSQSPTQNSSPAAQQDTSTPSDSTQAPGTIPNVLAASTSTTDDNVPLVWTNPVRSTSPAVTSSPSLATATNTLPDVDFTYPVNSSRTATTRAGTISSSSTTQTATSGHHSVSSTGTFVSTTSDGGPSSATSNLILDLTSTTADQTLLDPTTSSAVTDALPTWTSTATFVSGSITLSGSAAVAALAAEATGVPESKETSTASTGGSLNTIAIIGIVGGVLVALIIVYVIWSQMRKKRARESFGRNIPDDDEKQESRARRARNDRSHVASPSHPEKRSRKRRHSPRPRRSRRRGDRQEEEAEEDRWGSDFEDEVLDNPFDDPPKDRDKWEPTWYSGPPDPMVPGRGHGVEEEYTVGDGLATAYADGLRTVGGPGVARDMPQRYEPEVLGHLPEPAMRRGEPTRPETVFSYQSEHIQRESYSSFGNDRLSPIVDGVVYREDQTATSPAAAGPTRPTTHMDMSAVESRPHTEMLDPATSTLLPWLQKGQPSRSQVDTRPAPPRRGPVGIGAGGARGEGVRGPVRPMARMPSTVGGDHGWQGAGPAFR